MADDDYRRKGLPLDDYGLDMDSVRMDVEPESGLYYLMQVRREADAHPAVTIAPNRDALVFKKGSDATTQQIDLRLQYFSIGDTLKPFSQLPTTRYISTFLAEFATQRNHMHDYLQSVRDEPKLYFFKPYWSDRRSWKKFCYGYDEKTIETVLDVVEVVDNVLEVLQPVKRTRDEVEGVDIEYELENEYQVEEVDENLDALLEAALSRPIAAPQRSNKPPRIPHQGFLPTLSLLPHLSQKNITTLLNSFSVWLNEDGISEREFEWIMVLLLCVTGVMTCDEVSGVRALVKRCRLIRESMWAVQASATAMSSEVVGLGLIIAIGSRLFGQSDLGDVYAE